MAKGLTRSLGRGDALERIAPFNLNIPIRDLEVAITEDTSGWGTAVLDALPEGNVLFLGAVLYLDSMERGDENLAATFDGDFSLGSTATANTTLSGDNVDLIASTSTETAVGGVSSENRGASGTAVKVIDNTGGDKALNLNVLTDAGDTTDNSSLTVNGSLHVAYIMLGSDDIE